jgi:hypothetical protein
MQQKIGTGLLFVGQFMAAAVALNNVGEILWKFLVLLGRLISLIWAHSHSDLGHAGHTLSQFITTAIGLILFAIASWLLAPNKRAPWQVLKVGLIAGVILLIGKVTFLPPNWREAIFGPGGAAFAGGLILFGWAMRDAKE